MVENPHNTLVHLTMATMFLLEHTTLKDLDCSDELWKKYYRNPYWKSENVPFVNLDDMYTIHLEEDHELGLTRQQRFNAWKFRYDLVSFGPDYFRKFRLNVGQPEVIDEIPHTKSTQIPLRAVDVSPSTPLDISLQSSRFLSRPELVILLTILDLKVSITMLWWSLEIFLPGNVYAVFLNLIRLKQHLHDVFNLLSL